MVIVGGYVCECGLYDVGDLFVYVYGWDVC